MILNINFDKKYFPILQCLNPQILTGFQKLVLEKQAEIQELKKNKDKNKKEITGLNFKVINFRKTIKAINQHPNKITKGEDLKEVKGIGKGIMDRIDEILAEGTLKTRFKKEVV